MSDLNILHISFLDNLGGSARAAYRLHTGLRDLGVRSKMLVAMKKSRDPDVSLISNGAFRWLDKICDRITDRLGMEYVFYPSSFFLKKRDIFHKADILQIFNMHGGYFSFTALAGLSRIRPVVLRLDDMWAFTGHCSFVFSCDRWKKGCGSCPSLSDYPYPLARDMTAPLFRLKNRTYRHSSLVIVAPSKWMASMAKESPLLHRFPVHVIPYGLDTKIFRPIPKEVARKALDIKEDNRVILFGADAVHEPRKGVTLFREALDQLGHETRENTTLLVFGAGAENLDAPFSLPTKFMGHVQNDLLMAIIYSAADFFVISSLADNLPNVILESMACGTPVVAFDAGGISDAVRHMKTGYLAAEKDVDGLAHGMQTLLGNPDLLTRLGIQGCEIVEREYTEEIQAQTYLDLYRSILQNDTYR